MSMSSGTATRALARPAGETATAEGALWLRAFSYWMLQYKHTWRGTAFSSVLEPLGFLAAMGIGLGLLVDRGTGTTNLSGISYLDFVAPGFIAAAAMQTAVFESTFPVMGALKWHKQYHAMLATPLRSTDALVGHLLFVVFRLATSVTVFLVIASLFGAIGSVWAVLTVPVAVLTGLAYATPVFAFSATQTNDSGFSMLFRFGVVPMFLFSGTFFPVSQLPDWLEPVALAVPLWHGVDLCRALSLGTATWDGAAGHVAYLLVWVVVGFALARRTFRRRLEA
jgi:lipooligosaccharide transport system permease protein